MIHDVWLNLSSKDLDKTRTFYKALGFTPNPNAPPTMASFTAPGKVNIVICFVPPDMMKTFSGNAATDTETSNEVLISLGANSKEEVDCIAKVVVENGGTLFAEPKGDGWMYGCGFCDPDGHRWNPVYMDFEKMPK